jgi:gluconate 2-dehydrogenase gamma chain
MSENHDKTDGVSRREMLVQSGIAVGAIALPVVPALLPAEPQKTAELVLEGELKTFTLLEYETLDAICSRIIPSDDSGPGAREAKAARYIDWGMSGSLNSQTAGGRGGRGAAAGANTSVVTPRDQYAAALAAVEAYATSTKNASFSKLSPADQDAIITLLQNSQLPGAPMGFFNTIRMHTIQGTFSDPYYGGNFNCIGWDLIRYPGVRSTVPAEYQQWGTELKPNHQSAYDHDMFEKGVL